jgi:hypothetical protein
VAFEGPDSTTENVSVGSITVSPTTPTVTDAVVAPAGSVSVPDADV